MEYLPPFGRLGRWLLDGMIRRKLTRMFDYRHDTTRRLLETPHSAALIERTEATTGE